MRRQHHHRRHGTATASPSAASRGDAVYQVETSANVPGPKRGGSWFWLERDAGGAGAYAGADCAHGSPASSAHGTLTWEQQGDELFIHGIQTSDLPPFAYRPHNCAGLIRHDVATFAQAFPTLTVFLTSVGADVSNGAVQVQVAP